MELERLRCPDAAGDVLTEILGYLNFSSGTGDRKLLANLDALTRLAPPETPSADVPTPPREPVYMAIGRWLQERVAALTQEGGAFSDVTQAQAIVTLCWAHVLPAYEEFHRDLLFHQRPVDLWRPYLLGAVLETALQLGPPWEPNSQGVERLLGKVNDFVGYRPVATLEGRHCEPYPHERVRPIPLYVAGAGVAAGKYEHSIRLALDIIQSTDADLLAEAWFHPEQLEELALDPRAYDFDHPANRRPNYHFGQWDPHCIDNRGRYRRFVLQQVTLDALQLRLEQSDLAREEVQYEAAAVLAGTMLMASATSGDGPDCHSSDVTLGTLLPHIASFRDRFYGQLLSRLSGTHGERLREEAARLQQPFGGARQHLNQELARRRATQMQHVHLARLYARMGHADAAMRQAELVQVASARLLCQIYCRITAGHDAIDRAQLQQVGPQILEIEDLLHRGIGCGALVDPWNVVGFGGNFSIFPSPENSVHDYRIDDLVEVVEQVLSLCARAWSEAAVLDDAALEGEFSEPLRRLAAWWDQFATPSVESVRRLVGKEIEVSANLVAGALNAWHKAGAAAGDIAFWRIFVDQFDSPKAFQLVIEALLDQGDCVAARALMMQWVSQRYRTPLEDGDSSMHALSARWLRQVEQQPDGRWAHVRRFFERLEANAEEFWQAPELELDSLGVRSMPLEMPASEDADHEEGDDDESDSLFDAAYDNVVYRDSTADGNDADMLEDGAIPTDVELDEEARRIKQRLAFLSTLAKLWQRVAVVESLQPEQSDGDAPVMMASWRQQAEENGQRLRALSVAVGKLGISYRSQDPSALLEYDRRRLAKEGLLEQIIAAAVETEGATRLLAAAVPPNEQESHSAAVADADAGLPSTTRAMLRAILRADHDQVRALWDDFLKSLATCQLLYVPIARGGIPQKIIATRSLQRLVHDLLGWLPKLGMVSEALQLLQVAQVMEMKHPVGQGAVTEYDRLFDNGCRAVVRCVVASAASWEGASRQEVDSLLVEALQRVTEILLQDWLEHSRTLRLGVVEKLATEENWQQFVSFVRTYGGDLFTQMFLNLGNLRAILHQGVENWIEDLRDESEDTPVEKLVADLDDKIPLGTAVKMLTTAMEAVVENYREYRDYNSTTTQSDHGELLYTFVDFLRLRSEYDRVAWNLRPVVIAHETLVREGRNEAADMWRRALIERTSDAADAHCEQLEQLCAKHGMRLPTVSDRIAERFVRPLSIDRVRSTVGPAIRQAGTRDGELIFAALENEIETLAQEPGGAGLDLPDWLVALEDEVAKTRSDMNQDHAVDDPLCTISQSLLTWEDLDQQLTDTPRRGKK